MTGRARNNCFHDSELYFQVNDIVSSTDDDHRSQAANGSPTICVNLAVGSGDFWVLNQRCILFDSEVGVFDLTEAESLSR